MKLIDDVTRKVTVIEQRDRFTRPWRALPKAFGDHAAELDKKLADGKPSFRPQYQTFDGLIRTAVGCWKCGRAIQGWQRAMDPRTKAPIMIRANKEMLPAVCWLPYNHYRQGVVGIRRADGLFEQLEYMHCADCAIKSADLLDLVTCNLSGQDHEREVFAKVSRRTNPTDDEWATRLEKYSGAELLELVGPSHAPWEL